MNITQTIIQIIFIYLIILYFTRDESFNNFKNILSKHNIVTTEFFEILFFIYCLCYKKPSGTDNINISFEKLILNVVFQLKKLDIILTKRLYKNISIKGIITNNKTIIDILNNIENYIINYTVNYATCNIGGGVFKKELQKNIIVLKLFIIKYINDCQNKLFSSNEKDDIKNLYNSGEIQKIAEILINKLGIHDNNHFYYNLYLIIKESIKKRNIDQNLILNRKLHVGLILDGNRRFAKKNGLSNGHLFGSFNAIRIIHYLYNYGIKECTLYVLSYDNFIKRSSGEKKIIFTIIYSYLLELINYIVTCNNVYVQFIGEIDILPENIRIRILDIKKLCETKNINDCYIINYAIAYDGRREIFYSMKDIFKENKYGMDINNIISNSNSMWLKRDIDLVIRSGGTKRMSAFFPWQTTYSEWYFLNKFWPEVNEEDIYEIINNYNNTLLNFGA